jgi:anaerobic selenocysteine-containing dehydrogenase
LRTDDRRIELAPSPFVEDVERLRSSLNTSKTDERLLLIGRRHLRSNNSWMHNFPRLMGGRERCTLLMHPDDAERSGLVNGERVVVTSRTGRVEVPLEVTDEVGRGVVSLPHGWGHRRSGTRLGAAHEHAGASANDLTDDQTVDPSCGNAVLNGVPVRVTADRTSDR